jgi:uncharacterized protein
MINVRRWLHEHSLKLLAIRDTPEAIAGGVAIGIFFGFMPVLGLKTLSAIFFAWLTRCNILAAVIAGALHDIFLPVMPAVYFWEYKVGFWLLTVPHDWPPAMHKMHWEGLPWRNWRTFLELGKPLLVGGCLCSAPLGLASFFITLRIVERHQRKKRAKQAMINETEENPS